jgi:hypothetical protein
MLMMFVETNDQCIGLGLEVVEILPFRKESWRLCACQLLDLRISHVHTDRRSVDPVHF